VQKNNKLLSPTVVSLKLWFAVCFLIFFENLLADFEKFINSIVELAGVGLKNGLQNIWF
jgi:hypothetical protein